jgi:putative multiple sugar transport system permease protein
MQTLARRKRQSYGFDVPHIALFITQLAIVCGVILFFAYRLAQHRGMPMVLAIVAVLVIIYSFITNRTVFGRRIYAFGGNKLAARLSGINTKRVLFSVYANMGLLAALAGIIFTGRLNSATPKAGDGFELDAIAACFIGGASTSGGVGTIVGAIVGGLLMGVLNNGMAIMGVSIDWQQAVKGMVLLIAVAFDVLSKRNKTT